MAKPGAALLTRREREVLALVARGLDSRQIALDLGIAYFTVRKHRSNILGKLGLNSAAQLAAVAVAAAPDLAPSPGSWAAGSASAPASSRLPAGWRQASAASTSPGSPT